VSAQVHTPLFRWLLRHWVCTYLLMGLAFVVFGVLTLNLVQYFTANFEFLTMYGLEAVMEGGLLQLAQLALSAFVAVACWLLFKLCEQALVQRLAQEHKD
jgi:hypothetical protein